MAQRPSCAFPNEFQAAQPVLSAQDFYDYADEHFGWAETARTERRGIAETNFLIECCWVNNHEDAAE